jgi:hypothetical protein
MNIARHNRDLRLLCSLEEMDRSRFGMAPGWSAVDWKPTAHGGNLIFIRGYVLPPNCSRRRSDVKIEAPPNLYEPCGGGSSYIFYRNMWLAPGIEIWNPQGNCWTKVPRLFEQAAEDGFAFICIHPQHVTNAHSTIFHFLRALDLHLLNPGFKAQPGEAA